VFAALHWDALCIRLLLLTPLKESDLSLNSTPIRKHYDHIMFFFMIPKQFCTDNIFMLRSSLEYTSLTTKLNNKKRTACMNPNRRWYQPMEASAVLNVIGSYFQPWGTSQLMSVPLSDAYHKHIRISFQISTFLASLVYPQLSFYLSYNLNLRC
jgi:hypothetical protein